jgi:hypothetical protein
MAPRSPNPTTASESAKVDALGKLVLAGAVTTTASARVVRVKAYGHDALVTRKVAKESAETADCQRGMFREMGSGDNQSQTLSHAPAVPATANNQPKRN